ncbi:MAG TPA: alpha/beta fold hydrolase [Thermoanaerobaculia bacterium]|nr:alpha/beta fold hydrolase [Thermoanaerobaculia bacterium]
MRLRRSWWLAAGLTAIAAVAEPATDAARSDSWPVGFRVMAGSYVPASAANSEARPLQISVWYPASSARGKGMTYRDYVALNASELDPEKPAGKSGAEEAVEEFRSFLVSAKIVRSDVTRMLSTPMKAIANAPAAKGRFPLVLISQGNGQSAHDQAFLAEALAARGYIAATVPSATRISGPMKGEEEIAAKATEQAEDLSHAAERVKTQAELSEVGLAVVGHSFGARAALLFAMSNPAVRALVSLDGGIGVKTGRGMLERSRLFDARAMTAPILHFYEELDAFMEPDFALIDSLDGSFRRLVKVPDMHHVHFNSAGSLLQRAPSLAAATRATPGTARSVEAVESSTVSFLDSVLKQPVGQPLAAAWKPKDPAFSLVEKPAAARTGTWIAGPRGRLRVDDGGGSASGLLPVLFVHGNGGNHAQWSAQLEHLRSAGRRAAALDLRGMGGSDIAYDGDYSIDGFASDVAAAADALKLDRFVLVGHSFGGAVVAAYAGKHPDRLAGLVFADVTGDMRGTPQAQIETLMRGLQPPTYEEFTRRWFGAILAKGTDATKAAVLKSLRATPREVFVAATTGLYSFDQGAALTPYRGPRLHIASFLIGNAQAIDKAYADMPVRTISDASHWLMLDRPEEFNRILDEFLAGLK